MAKPFINIKLDKEYRLRFGMGAMIEFEQLTGIKLTEISDEISFTIAAKLLWVMLKQEQPNLTLEETSRLVDDNVDDLMYIINTVIKAVEAAFPQQTVEISNLTQPIK